MFTVQEFAGKVMEDFMKEFPEVELGEKYIRIGRDNPCRITDCKYV